MIPQKMKQYRWALQLVVLENDHLSYYTAHTDTSPLFTLFALIIRFINVFLSHDPCHCHCVFFLFVFFFILLFRPHAPFLPHNMPACLSAHSSTMLIRVWLLLLLPSSCICETLPHSLSQLTTMYTVDVNCFRAIM